MWTEGVGMRDRGQERQNKETWEAKKGGREEGRMEGRKEDR